MSDSDAAEINKIAEKQLEKMEKELTEDPSIKSSIKVVEAFLKSHRVMCYGGTAINNLLKPFGRGPILPAITDIENPVYPP